MAHVNPLRHPGLSVLALLTLWALPLQAQKVPVIEKQLPNGMKLLLVVRHDEPSVSAGWVAHVGSANERPGITGIAHLFEHMMFKGTPTLGTKNYQRDQEIIAEQEKVRDQMREEEAKLRLAFRRGEIDDLLKPENMTPRWRELNEQFKKLVAEQRELLVKNEFDRVYTTAGASGMNAFTTEDMTCYFITVPANKLELWMWMESERLMHPVFREFYAERDVVMEERRMRTESTPLGKFQEEFNSMFWESSNYHWPIIGWPFDVTHITMPEAKEFYATYYAPQNITAILVGDFDPDQAAQLAERYLGRIPRGAHDAPAVLSQEVPQVAEKRMNAEAETNPLAEVWWHTVSFGHADSYPLQILSQILSTRTGRLYKGLVLGSQVATDADAAQVSRKYAGFFVGEGEAKEGRTPQVVEQAVYAEIEKLQKEPVPAEELQKVKNNFAANEYRKLSSSMAILHQLLMTDGYGNWREINEAGPRLQAVTAEDVQRVARKYFTQENRATALYTRKPEAAGAAAAPADPDLAGLPAEQQTMLKQMTTRLKAETDAAKLHAALAKMEGQAAQAPAEMKSFLEVVKKKMQARIAELEAK